jgi:hypothetical protein
MVLYGGRRGRGERLPVNRRRRRGGPGSGSLEERVDGDFQSFGRRGSPVAWVDEISSRNARGGNDVLR